jgi:hypothetical protein
MSNKVCTLFSPKKRWMKPEIHVRGLSELASNQFVGSEGKLSSCPHLHPTFFLLHILMFLVENGYSLGFLYYGNSPVILRLDLKLIWRFRMLEKILD